MERRTRHARPALRSLFGPASFGPAGELEPQHRSRNRHADQRLRRFSRGSRSRRAPRNRRDNHQDDDRRPTLSRCLPRHVPSLSPHVSTYVKQILLRPLCVGRTGVASPFRGRERRDSLDRGISDARSMCSIRGERISRARKQEWWHLRRRTTFHGRAPVTGRKPPGLSSFGAVAELDPEDHL